MTDHTRAIEAVAEPTPLPDECFDGAPCPSNTICYTQPERCTRTTPLPDEVEAALERIKCALFPQEDFCWRMEQDDTDECGCLPCIPESLATLRDYAEQAHRIVIAAHKRADTLRSALQAAENACGGCASIADLQERLAERDASLDTYKEQVASYMTMVNEQGAALQAERERAEAAENEANGLRLADAIRERHAPDPTAVLALWEATKEHMRRCSKTNLTTCDYCMAHSNIRCAAPPTVEALREWAERQRT